VIHYEADRRKWTFNRIPKIGDIYAVNFNWFTSHSEHLVKGVHLLLVLQTPELNKSPLRVCVPLTSLKEKHLNTEGKLKYPMHYLLRKDDYSFLEKDTIVKCEQIITIEWRKFLPDQNYCGTIKRGDLLEITMKMAKVIGIEYIHSRRKK